MRIDRARFLAITGALAGCSPPAPVASPGGTLEIPQSAPPTPDASAIAMPEPDASAPHSTRDAWAGPSAEGDPDPNDTCTASNAQGTPADCTQLKSPPGPQCESFDDTVDECNDMKRTLKPAVAEKATKCLLAKSGTRAICQFAVAATCAASAFRGSCGDPSTMASCKAVAQKCASAPMSSAIPRVTIAECQGALSAVAAKHRPLMLSCMNEGCTSGYCFSYLK